MARWHLCAFDSAPGAERIVAREAERAAVDGAGLLLVAVVRQGGDLAGPGAPRVLRKRLELTAALERGAGTAASLGVESGAALVAGEGLDEAAIVRAVAAGARRVVVAEAPSRLARLRRRTPAVRRLLARPQPLAKPAGRA